MLPLNGLALCRPRLSEREPDEDPLPSRWQDGEVVAGEYRVAFGGSVGTAFSGAWSASAIVIRDGPVQFVARGPKTQVLCRGTSNPMGHGNGECQTFEGAVWTISW